MKVSLTVDEIEKIKEQKEKFESDYNVEPNILMLPHNYWTLNDNGTSNTLIRYWDGMLVVIDSLNEKIRCGLGQITEDERINIAASKEHHKNMDIEPKKVEQRNK